MRKAITAFSAFFFVISLFVASTSFAAANKMTGKVKSVDAAKSEIVVTDNKTKADVTLKVNEAILKKKFKAGDVVNVVLEKEGVAKKINKALTVPVGC